jgi:hypothetical protein
LNSRLKIKALCHLGKVLCHGHWKIFGKEAVQDAGLKI